MNHQHLIKENIQKLVLHHRKRIINEVVQSGVLKEGFENNRIPKDLTEEQLLYVISECLSEDGNFILKNYKILTHPNPTPEMLDEATVLGSILKGAVGVAGDAFKAIQKIGKWAWDKTLGKWIWRGQGKPTSPKPTAPPPPPPEPPLGAPAPPKPPQGPLNTPNGYSHDEFGRPWDIDRHDIDDPLPNIDIFDSPVEPNPSHFYPSSEPFPNLRNESGSMSNFNHKMKYLMESNRQIDPNFLHTMLKQVNESKYLLELAIQRNQVNRIIDRI
jgi:hypothetical protein